LCAAPGRPSVGRRKLGAPESQEREDDDGLHPCAEPRGSRDPEPARPPRDRLISIAPSQRLFRRIGWPLPPVQGRGNSLSEKEIVYGWGPGFEPVRGRFQPTQERGRRRPDLRESLKVKLSSSPEKLRDGSSLALRALQEAARGHLRDIKAGVGEGWKSRQRSYAGLTPGGASAGESVWQSRIIHPDKRLDPILRACLSAAPRRPISTPFGLKPLRAYGLPVGRPGRRRAGSGALLYRRRQGRLSSPIDSPAIEGLHFLSRWIQENCAEVGRTVCGMLRGSGSAAKDDERRGNKRSKRG